MKTVFKNKISSRCFSLSILRIVVHAYVSSHVFKLRVVLNDIFRDEILNP